MKIDVYSAAGAKSSSLDLSTSLFGDTVNWDLMHQAVVRQQSNRRASVAHAKTRGEVAGSTRKLFAQKGTGRARRGAVRSPLVRGGGKTFGPRNDRNFQKDMPKKMRHAALRSCLSLQANEGVVLGLEGWSDSTKTKDFAALLQKMPVEMGRRILVVAPEKMETLTRSSRNVAGVKTITASYLNPEDILNARHIIFLVDALKKAEELFGQKGERAQKAPKTEKIQKTQKKSSESSSSSRSSSSLL